MARKPRATSKQPAPEAVDYRHDDKRKNLPPAKMERQGSVPKALKATYHYNPHLPPELRFDPTGGADAVPALIATAQRRALTAEEATTLAEALRNQQPWLEWAGKKEEHDRGSLRVNPVALHLHERVSAKAIVRAAMREDADRSLFGAMEEQYSKAVQFYRHDVDWANRMILGDSLEVMSSLAHREGLAGKVQMIYMDPPYGIKFASNFQPEVGKRDVKEKDQDLTREPEMVRAYRDTWHLGIHSYLTYLRDRLIAAKSLLADTGSVFVQISDENLSKVVGLMDEVYGTDQRMGLISFITTGGQTSDRLPSTTDYLVWYAKAAERVKYRVVYAKRGSDDTLPSTLSWYARERANGHIQRLAEEQLSNLREIQETSEPFWLADLLSRSGSSTTQYQIELEGRATVPHRGGWRTSADGMRRVIAAERLQWKGEVILFRRLRDDFWLSGLSTLWSDTQQGGFRQSDKLYVVQTPAKVIERCLMMTTDPGDLVLDPTCGSGTTAYVAEQWGRRWITTDTSRVALSIARQRLLTAKFDYYRTKGPAGGAEGVVADDPGRGFLYKKVPHITLKSIAQNDKLDPIFARHEPLLAEALERCNAALKQVTPSLATSLAAKLAAKQAAEGKRAITDADRRRWVLPPANRDPKAKWTVDPSFKGWYHWEVPFDTDEDWPKGLREAVTAYRAAWRAKMDDVNACIAESAEQEELVDQPEVVKGVVRVSGPFTVEGVRPEELSLTDEGVKDLTPNEEEPEEDAAADLQNVHAYLKGMVDALKADGLTFPNNKRGVFAEVTALYERGALDGLHAEGWWNDDTERAEPVAIAFGPQYGPITARQVEDCIHAATRYRHLVLAGFSFAPEAAAIVGEQSHPKLRIHLANIRPDMNPAMKGLLKETKNSQLFSVFGLPEIKVDRRGEEYVVELKGVDIFDPVAGTVQSAKASKVAAWFLDSDFDNRCFCTTQAFFPNQDAWEKIAKALGDAGNAAAFEAFKGTESLPFKAGTHRRIAVKVIDPRGNEVMTVQKLG